MVTNQWEHMEIPNMHYIPTSIDTYSLTVCSNVSVFKVCKLLLQQLADNTD